MSKNNLISNAIHKLFKGNFDFRVQIFNTLGFLGFMLGIVFGTFSIHVHTSMQNIIFNYSSSVIAAVVIMLARKTGRYKLFFLVTVILVFIIIFPILFCMGGGITSGRPSFFVFAVVFTVIMLEGKRRAIFTVFEILLYLTCLMTAYYRPEAVVPFTTETDMAKDIIVGCLGSSIVLVIAIYQHIAVYDRKQKELEEANIALQGLNHMKTEFLQNISHELKTPITVIANYARDTIKELGKPSLNIPEMDFDQNRIISETERLDRMVSQLLDVTSIEGGRLKIYKEPLSLASLIRRMADSNTDSLSERGNSPVLEVPDSLPDVYADRDIIEQVLLNLMSNAVRHTKKGTITISLSAAGDFQEVRVSDTGDGIHPDVLKQVFLRYVEREDRVTGSNGLGLYICKKYIDAHDGVIDIKSEQGMGTTVWFRLPTNIKDGVGNE
jgi:signal transduction histidine kinase